MLRRFSSSLSPVFRRCTRSFSGSADNIKKTALYDLHVQLGGKIVPFAGYALPVKYKLGDIDAHNHCRKAAALFDVSHMGQVRIHGVKRVEFLESLVPSDVVGLKPNQARLSVLTNEKGGIIDDCIITNKVSHLFMVVNGACKEKDLAHMNKHLEVFNEKNKANVKIEYIQDRSLLALQGPRAAEVLQKLVPSYFALSGLEFMTTADVKVDGVECYVTRCGYTGEDGFEISIPNDKAPQIMQALLAVEPTQPTGLGARDSLRLEAGLCLYGHDLNEDITPIEASLNWLIGKRRREQGGFLGYDVISKQLKEGVSKKRVGFLVTKGAPAREEAEILSKDGKKIGVITSGTFSPVLKKPVSMGYIATEFSKDGTEVNLNVRGKLGEAKVTKMPFVPSNYYKPAAPKK